MRNNNEGIDLLTFDYKDYTSKSVLGMYDYNLSKVHGIINQIPSYDFDQDNNSNDALKIKQKLSLMKFTGSKVKRQIILPNVDDIEIFQKPNPPEPEPEPVPIILLQPIKEKAIQDNEQLSFKEENLSCAQILIAEPKSQPSEANHHPPQSNPIQLKKYQSLLYSGAENFAKIKLIIKDLVFNNNYQKQIDRILMTLNPIISQMNEEVDIRPTTDKINKALNELYQLKNKDLFLITIDQILSLIFNKSENFMKITKTKYLYITKVINDLNSSSLTNLFFQKIAYNCSYIIPKQFTKKDFPNKDLLLQRQGFLEEGEPLIDLNNRMESYEYLYFSLMYHDINKYQYLIVEYLQILTEINVNFAIGNGFKVFLNVFGNKVKSLLWKQMQSVAKKVVQELTKESTHTKIKDIKSINDSNCFKINKYIEQIAHGQKTDMFS